MITAKTLLYKVLDYDWIWNSSKKMRDTASSKARKLQIDSLLKAFEISKKNAISTSQVPPRTNDKNVISKMFYGSSRRRNSLKRLDYIKTLTNFHYFISGEFLADRERDRYNDTLTHIISVVNTSFPHKIQNNEPRPVNLVRLFYDLYNLRHIAFNTFESSFLKQTSQDFLIEDAYGQTLKESFIKNLRINFTEIDEVLCLLIDPEKRSFSEAEIKYPEFDLEVLDLNWQEAFRNKL